MYANKLKQQIHVQNKSIEISTESWISVFNV